MESNSNFSKNKKPFPKSNNKFDTDLMTPFFRQSIQISNLNISSLLIESEID